MPNSFTRACLGVTLAALSTLVAAAEPATVTPADKPVAIVNGVAIPQIHASFLRRERAARGQPAEALSDEAVREALVASELLAQEALKKPIDPTVQSLLEFQRRDILGRAALEDFARQHPIPEDILKKEYDNTKAKAGTTEYRARHILVDSENQAKDLITQLKGKKKVRFEDLAKKYSKDSSAGNGGDLGWVLPANLVPEFAQAMTGLEKGQITDKPVHSQFGWHVIRLEETRALDFPDYERLKPRIQQQLQQAQVRQWLRELMATAKVE